MNHTLEAIFTALLVVLGVAILANLPELRRYLRIRRM